MEGRISREVDEEKGDDDDEKKKKMHISGSLCGFINVYDMLFQ